MTKLQPVHSQLNIHTCPLTIPENARHTLASGPSAHVPSVGNARPLLHLLESFYPSFTVLVRSHPFCEPLGPATDKLKAAFFLRAGHLRSYSTSETVWGQCWNVKSTQVCWLAEWRAIHFFWKTKQTETPKMLWHRSTPSECRDFRSNVFSLSHSSEKTIFWWCESPPNKQINKKHFPYQ